MNERDTAFEELVLQESIVSATGLNSGNIQVGIKGDPSLRESVLLRKKYSSPVDQYLPALENNLQDLLLNRSTYRIYIGFNSGEIRTHSIFDPMREEVHEAAKIADQDYINRQFPPISYEDKVEGMRDIYVALRRSELYQKLPDYWKRIMEKRSERWTPLARDQIPNIVSTLRILREMQEYYLRNISICLIQSIVRMSFNCDGTQIVRAEDFKRFLTENIPIDFTGQNNT